jgi:hypothetical protein
MGRFQHRDWLAQYAAVNCIARAALMRRFVSPAYSPCLLPGGVAISTASRPLTAHCGTAQRLAAADLRTLPSAVDVAVVAAAANAHLHPAAVRRGHPYLR